VPHTVQKRKASKPWKVVDKRTGKVKASSETKRTAQASARIGTSARTTSPHRERLGRTVEGAVDPAIGKKTSPSSPAAPSRLQLTPS
jgi:hypothetical protein